MMETLKDAAKLAVMLAGMAVGAFLWFCVMWVIVVVMATALELLGM